MNMCACAAALLTTDGDSRIQLRSPVSDVTSWEESCASDALFCQASAQPETCDEYMVPVTTLHTWVLRQPQQHISWVLRQPQQHVMGVKAHIFFLCRVGLSGVGMNSHAL